MRLRLSDGNRPEQIVHSGKNHTFGPVLDYGFTIIELIVTLVLVGVMASIAVPRLIGNGVFQSRSFFDQTQSVVRYAQRVAVAQRRNVFVVVAMNGVSACYDAACVNPVLMNSGDTQGAGSTSPSSSVTLSGTTFSFNGLGQPSSGTVITFNSTIADDPARSITVENETGYVH